MIGFNLWSLYTKSKEKAHVGIYSEMWFCRTLREYFVLVGSGRHAFWSWWLTWSRSWVKRCFRVSQHVNILAKLPHKSKGPIFTELQFGMLLRWRLLRPRLPARSRQYGCCRNQLLRLGLKSSWHTLVLHFWLRFHSKSALQHSIPIQVVPPLVWYLGVRLRTSTFIFT